jgi:transposase
VNIYSQKKNTIFNVYNYFKKLSNDKVNVEVTKYFCQTQQITADACGVSLSTVKRITTEGVKSMVQAEPEVGLSSVSFTSPRKQYKRAKYATGIDDFDADIVRRTIHEFYDNREYPTTKLLSKYQEKTEYKGSKTSMWRILRSLQFKYKKCNDGR